MLQGVFIFKRVFKGDLDVGGGPEGELKGDLEGDFRGDFRGDFKQDFRTWKGTCCRAQVS